MFLPSKFNTTAQFYDNYLFFRDQSIHYCISINGVFGVSVFNEFFKKAKR